MSGFLPRRVSVLAALLFYLTALTADAQEAPYDAYPTPKAPYFRVRYASSSDADQLQIAVSYTVWIPPSAKTVRGIVVHQHGCGEGSCRSGITGAYDLHWQALAEKNDCALLAAVYEQPADVDCQLWCDPRNGSANRFVQALSDLAQMSGHQELTQVPWALWGHSGGGHWAGGMTLLYPDRVVAAWLRSGVPLVEQDPARPSIRPYTDLPSEALGVPIMCNPGTKEGVSVTDGRFARVWPKVKDFFFKMRGEGGLIAVAVDPLTSHECGNQRYLAIPWFDYFLRTRLPDDWSGPSEIQLKPVAVQEPWLAALGAKHASPQSEFQQSPLRASWLPTQEVALAWSQYVTNTEVLDTTPPPAPYGLRLSEDQLTWNAKADLESGLAHFLILRDGELLTRFPEQMKNRFGRPIFQNLQYSDTPTQPLATMSFQVPAPSPGTDPKYSVIAVNTVGLQSVPSQADNE